MYGQAFKQNILIFNFQTVAWDEDKPIKNVLRFREVETFPKTNFFRAAKPTNSNQICNLKY
jgi:hypothetical protein